jgi:hypothetical protein
MQARGQRFQRQQGWWLAGIVALAAMSATACGTANTEGRSPSYLQIDTLQAASGAKPSDFGGVLQSDVVTLVKTQVDGKEVLAPTIYEDNGRVSLTMALKDVGSSSSPTQPSSINAITVTRYHVDYRRTDGRNTAGVDVPYGFDGAATGTIGTSGATLVFTIVRAQAKLEAPLKAMAGGGGAVVISTIADVTFYGRDQNGNAVSVTGSISINFTDWADPS